MISIFLLITVIGCIKEIPNNPPISKTDKISVGKGFIYPKADKEWDKYIGLFQKDAASVASRKEYWPDDNTFTYLRSYSGVYSSDEYLGYVWRWISGGQNIVFLSGMIDEAGITNLVLNNKNNLTIDEIIMSFTADKSSVLLGEYGVDYHMNVWTDYSTEAKYNLDSSIIYPAVKENDVVNLLSYSDYVNCEAIYWMNGNRRGASSVEFKALLSNLTASVEGNNIGEFAKQLPEVLNMECSHYFERELQELFSKYERTSSKGGMPESRGIFLEKMLKLSNSNTFGGREVCEVINNNIYHKSKSYPNESTVLAELFLKYADTTNIQCGLSRAISSASKVNNLEFLRKVIDIEASNLSSVSSKNKQKFQRIIISALENASAVGNLDAVILLSEYLSDAEISKDHSTSLMIAVGKGGNVDILNLLLKRNLNIDFSEDEILEVSLRKGDYDLVKKLFDIGFKLPDSSRILEGYIWSVFKYHKPYSGKNSDELLTLLVDHGFKFSSMEERDRFVLMSRVYSRAHSAWIDSSEKTINSKEAERYKQSVIDLTKIYVANVSSINNQFGRKNLTLLMKAVEGNLPEVVKLILESKPNLSIKNKSGKTALDIAMYEATVYILGSRRGFDKEYKENAARIVSLLGGDITPFRGRVN